ncbi:hypothetical protein FACS1894116_12100 [Betaproteobacteria bacterium]|nr:hypothetical protein FACS1894116_12100 [Betaproteobacteria bacterium]
MQAFWLVHRLEHSLTADEKNEAACEFCISIHGMGAVPLASAQTLASALTSEAPPQTTSSAQRNADPVHPRQQGPPRLS